MDMGIYVERVMDAEVAQVWALTQSPELHERWDLRFTSIRYLPRERAEEPQRFEYRTRIGLGLCISGTGRTVSQRGKGEGESSSALVFGSDDRLSLIRKGSGYWRYVPVAGGRMRFVTGYDYAVRWGRLGWAVDRALFRPVMAWATAWSFDRLARWAERGVSPETSLRISAAYAIARVTLAGVWLYQGLFPKLLGPHPEEVAMSVKTGVPPAWAEMFVRSMGVGEILLGLWLLAAFHRRIPALVSAVAMAPALVLGMRAAPELVTAPFNVVTLNTLTAALAVIVMVLGPEVVRASSCTWSAYRRG
jgi:uncharacterized membrane protein YphA (DoxX/SURF4 family)